MNKIWNTVINYEVPYLYRVAQIDLVTSKQL